MPKFGMHGVLDWLRRSVLADVSCGELLKRFVHGRGRELPGDSKAEDAFAELVRRHGPKVYGVCRRILGDRQLAEDAFQATFVVLAKRAHTVRSPSTVGSFLYGVARHAALKASAMNRRRKEQAMSDLPDKPAAMTSFEPDALAMLDEEIANLSAAHRAAVVMCEIDGVGRSKAAKQLGIAEGTLSSRLAAARKQLRKRLLRRGVSLSSGMLAALADSAHAVVPLGLTVAAAKINSSALPHAVSVIAHGVLKAMLLGSLKTVTMFGAALFLVSGLGFGLLSGRHELADAQGKADPIDKQQVAPAESQVPKQAQDAKPHNDVHGDPLPLGALARLGTLRQRAADSQLAVSADGKDIVTVSSDMTVRVWDSATGHLRSTKQLPDEIGDANNYKTFLSPHGKYVLRDANYLSEKHRLDVWDVAKGSIAYSHSLPRVAWIEAAEFSADERKIAIAETKNDGRRGFQAIRVWELETSQMRTLHESGQQSYRPVARFSPDGKYLVARLNPNKQHENSLHCWDLVTDKHVWKSDRAFPFPHSNFCFTADSKVIVGRHHDPLDAATGKSVPWKWKPDDERWTPLAASPDGRHFAFLTFEHDLLVCEIAIGKKVLHVPKSRLSGARFTSASDTRVAFMPDGSHFVCLSDVLQRLSVDGNSAYPNTREWGHTAAVVKLIFSSDGKSLASVGKYDRVLLWNLAAARAVYAIPGGYNELLAFTADGKHLLTSDLQKQIVLEKWDTATGKSAGGFDVVGRRDSLTGSRDSELRVTSDGKKILLLTYKEPGRNPPESTFAVWDFASGKCLRCDSVPWREDSRLTPDGESVLTVDPRDGEIVLRALDTGEYRWRLPFDGLNLEQLRLKNLQFRGHELDLSTDGRFMSSRAQFYGFNTGVSYDGIRIGNTKTGQQLMKLAVNGPAHFTFSPDNRLFAVAAADGVRFWEIASQKQVGFLPAPNRNAIPPGQACASAIAFSPDSRTLATGHTDCTILLWDATFGSAGIRSPLVGTEQESSWAILAGDAAQAQSAGWRFVDDPKSTVPFLRTRLASLTAAPNDKVQQLIRDLESDQFKRREAADKELRALGNRAESGLREALKSKPSLEASRRIEGLLALTDTPPPFTGERIRSIRAIQILERIMSAESRELLTELSQGMRPTWLKRAAAESLERMKTRSMGDSSRESRLR